MNPLTGRSQTFVAEIARQATQVSGRQDKEPNAKLARKLRLAAFEFDEGTILFTEAGSKKWADIHRIRSVEDSVVIELKATEGNVDLYKAQLLTIHEADSEELRIPSQFQPTSGQGRHLTSDPGYLDSVVQFGFLRFFAPSSWRF